VKFTKEGLRDPFFLSHARKRTVCRGVKSLKASEVWLPEGERDVETLERLNAYAANRGIRYITEFDLPELKTFRGTWPDSPLTATKNLERLRSMFGAFHDYGWIPENPARRLKPPKEAESNVAIRARRNGAYHRCPR
jgi:hypothetical protein